MFKASILLLCLLPLYLLQRAPVGFSLGAYQYQLTFNLTVIVDDLGNLYSYVLRGDFVRAPPQFQTIGYELVQGLPQDNAVIAECSAALISSGVVKTVCNSVFAEKLGSAGITVDYVAVVLSSGNTITATHTYWWIIPVGWDYQCYLNMKVTSLFECDALFDTSDAQDFASTTARYLKEQSIVIQDNYFNNGPEVKTLGTCTASAASTQTITTPPNGGGPTGTYQKSNGVDPMLEFGILAGVAVIGFTVIFTSGKKRR